MRAAILAAAALLLLLLAGCKSQVRYIAVPEVHRAVDTVRSHTADTVVQRDTRLIYIKGDTVIDRRDRWREHTRLVRDTVVRERRDTVAVAVEVPAPLNRWQRTKQALGGYALAALAAAAWLAWRICRGR